MSTFIGKNVVVRDNMAGVFVGTLTENEGKTWTLANARKIHYWTQAAAVEGLAVSGCGIDSRLTPAVSATQGCDLIQIVLCSEAGYASLMGMPVWTP